LEGTLLRRRKNFLRTNNFSLFEMLTLHSSSDVTLLKMRVHGDARWPETSKNDPPNEYSPEHGQPACKHMTWSKASRGPICGFQWRRSVVVVVSPPPPILWSSWSDKIVRKFFFGLWTQYNFFTKNLSILYIVGYVLEPSVRNLVIFKILFLNCRQLESPTQKNKSFNFNFDRKKCWLENYPILLPIWRMLIARAIAVNGIV
jgi:hypothetical protein